MIIRRIHETRKRSIERRLYGAVQFNAAGAPTFSAGNIHYEAAQKVRAINVGGIGLIHKLAQQSGLIDAINSHLSLLKINMPYTESDHVLNIAYNAICGGASLEDIELRRNDEVFLDAIGAASIPDPTTAGDFCRRFDSEEKIAQLQRAINEARLNVWARQENSFFEQAIIEMDGHILGTTGCCKAGMDMSYKGVWGYHPLLVSLANTGEVLSLRNRSGSRPSYDQSAADIDEAIDLCRRAGFRSILLRGDTDFSQTEHFDRWDEAGVIFHFGYDAKPNLVEIADNLPEEAWEELQRPPQYTATTSSRQRPENVKDTIVYHRGYEKLHLLDEAVAEFEYRPGACDRSYRMIVIRKNITHEKGEVCLFDEIRYFFYISNDAAETPQEEIVFSCNDRCNQENVIRQLVSGVRALHAPVDNLYSNWAYMVMMSLAWNMKVWAALWLPDGGRWAEKHREEKRKVLRMTFRSFVQSFIQIPCQIIRGCRRVVYRLLNWNPWLPVFRRLAIQLQC